jgi:hypothetical protein
LYYRGLLLHIQIKIQPLFVLFTEVVWGGRNDELHRTVRDGAQQIKAISLMQHYFSPAIKPGAYFSLTKHQS